MKLRSNTHTAQTRRVLECAREESRRLQHGFIGTEHLLLGLLREDSVTAVLKALGLDAAAIRCEVERMVPMGSEAVGTETPPLTPRAAAAIDHAAAEAAMLLQAGIAPEHLLVGLLVEGGGVAWLVLGHLGLTPEAVRPLAYRIRVMQMKTVERIVRPVRANISRRRKMREELLAHLEAIYGDEMVRLNDPDAAIREAARRLGQPAELTRELQNALPYSERFSHAMERHFGWRAPESAARYLSRVALQTFSAIALCCCIGTAAIVARLGWNAADWIAIRPLIALTLFIPPFEFLIGLLYFKMRDAIWGVFGARRSMIRTMFLGLCLMGVTLFFDFGFNWVLAGDYQRAMQLKYSCISAAIAAAITSFTLAHLIGRTQIADTLWACLDVEI